MDRHKEEQDLVVICQQKMEKRVKRKSLRLRNKRNTRQKKGKKQTSKLPKKLSVLNKIINEKNLARKDCLLLPFITVKKMLKDL